MRLPVLMGAIAGLSILSAPIRAQTLGEFYKGKSIELDVGAGVGGGYDAYARILARHMSKYIPGDPAIVVRNVPGAGGLRLANLLYNVAPKDGTTFGTIFRGVAFEPLFGNKSAQFDATKFTWIGSTSNEVSVCVSWHTTGVSNFQDLLAKTLVMGASGPSGDQYVFTKILNGVLDTKMKLVLGYRGSREMDLAMERGEIGGRCGWSWSSMRAAHQDWIDQKKVNILIQLGLTKKPDLGDVPLVMDMAKTDEQRKILKLVFARQSMAFPFVGPPGTPADRATALRQAFDETMKDPEFLADAKAAKLDVAPMRGTEVESLIREVYGLPPALVEKTIALLK